MAEPIRISAKTLGWLAMPGFCPRCFWIQMHADGLPYQIFPGIFSSIDAYSKRLIHAWFDRHGTPPAWLKTLGAIKGYRTPPHSTKFKTLDSQTQILLTGTPDGIFVRGDDSHLIVDYKTAKFTATQDSLFPLYEAQLNAYAYIGERCGFAPVSGLALIYTEPVTHDEAVEKDQNLTTDGFVMGFSAHILPVRLKPQLIGELLMRAREILDPKRAPRSKAGCKDCALLSGLVELVRAESRTQEVLHRSGIIIPDSSGKT